MQIKVKTFLNKRLNTHKKAQNFRFGLLFAVIRWLIQQQPPLQEPLRR